MRLVVVTVDTLNEWFVWACERSKIGNDVVASHFSEREGWEIGEASSTLNPLDGSACASHLPVRLFVLPARPEETFSVPEFRTMSADLSQVSTQTRELADGVHEAALV